jgi:DNA polymerase-3 subunit beta
MKITILQENLKKGLSVVSRVISKSLTLPILNNILIETEKSFLKLVTTDLEMGFTWWSLAKIEKEGKTTVPIKILNNFINLLPNRPVTLTTENEILSIECQNYKTKIKTLPAEDFPIIPKISNEKAVTVKGASFCQGLAQVVDMAQPSSARPEISGIYLLFLKDVVKMVATDSFRLAEKKINIEKTTQDYSLILPQKTARELINVFSEREDEFKIYFSPNQTLFEVTMSETSHPQIQLVSRIIEGEYPNYEAIIPKGYKTLITLKRDEFLNQIKAASLFSGRISEIKLRADPKKEGVDILSQDPDLGEYHSFFPGKVKGEKVDVSFNHRFLIDGLLNTRGEDLSFEINGEDGPAALKPLTDQNYLYIVMPIKTD